MKRAIACLVALGVIGSLGIGLSARAQSPTGDTQLENQDHYWRAEVTEILEEGTRELAEGLVKLPFQRVGLKFLNGEKAGQEIIIEHGDSTELRPEQLVAQGDTVVVLESQALGDTRYFIVDRYRLPPIAIILAVFLALAIFIGRWKGLGSLIGLALSVFVLVKLVMPRIVAGSDPLLVSLLAAFGIALFSIYLAHGVSRRTTVALMATLLTLGLAAGLAALFVELAHLTGLGSDEAFYLQVGALTTLNARGLLLGGIIIGALGVLDDITTAQVATVDELHQANPALSRSELYRRAASVGKEHIAALVNTLALAYVGASFPLLLLFATNVDQPVWFLLNGELVTEEIVRTLVGSTALLCAVPLTTWLAVRFLHKGPRQPSS